MWILVQNVCITTMKKERELTQSYDKIPYNHRLVWELKLYSVDLERKRKRSDSVLWQKPIHQQKCQKGKVTTQTTPQKSSTTHVQRLWTDLGRSVGVTYELELNIKFNRMYLFPRREEIDVFISTSKHRFVSYGRDYIVSMGMSTLCFPEKLRKLCRMEILVSWSPYIKGTCTCYLNRYTPSQNRILINQSNIFNLWL